MALKIYHLLQKHNKRVRHDHLAFRTINLDTCNTQQLSEELMALGFCPTKSDYCEVQNLTLNSFRHPGQDYPGVLISEFDIKDLNEQEQAMLQELVESAGTSPQLGTRPWVPPTRSDYHRLAETSPFAAWFSLFGFTTSYWSVDVNQLDRQNDMQKLIKLLTEEGFPLNNQHGLITGSPENLMEQIATLPDQIEYNFGNGHNEKVVSAHYRFSLRYKNPAGKPFKELYPASES